MKERVTRVLEHAALHITQYGERGMLTFRKHLSWYFKAGRVHEDPSEMKALRMQLVQVKTLDELRGLLQPYI